MGLVVAVFFVAMADDAQIEVCPDGYGFNSVANQCTVCLAGYYGPDANNLCSPCDAGYYSRAGSASCTICPAGTYCEDIATGTPTKCPKGTHAWVDGSDELCSCEGDDCDPCDNPECSLCGATSSDICVSCPAGTYSDRKGTVECTLCPTGTYSSTVAATSLSTCLKCPKGTASNVEGATSIDTCEECADGYYAEEEGTDICDFCTDSEGMGRAMYIPQDKSACVVCPSGNCCYAFKAYACNKGTYSTGGLACPESNIAYTSHDTCQSNERGGAGGNRSGGGMCMIINFDMFPRKGVCTSCPSGCTTEAIGSVSGDDCTIKTINQFCARGGCFSWPTDGSISEQSVSNPDIRLAGSCPR